MQLWSTPGPTGLSKELLDRFDVADPSFIENPYPVLNELREATPIFWNEETNQWMLTRFDDVSRSLKNRKLGRDYSHLFTHDELGRSGPDGRWQQFNDHERWSLLCLEPPDHTRLRRLISKVFTPRAVATLADSIEGFSNDLLDKCESLGTFDLLSDYAQPYSVAVICSMLGVPTSDTQLLLDWSHAIVKMYELTASEEVKIAADRAAGEYIDYTRELIAEKRRAPDGLLVSELVKVEDAGDTLTEAEVISTTMVLVEAGHEATVNTLGNGFRALMDNREQWERLISGSVEPASAVEELLRFDPPLQMFERWVLEPGLEIGGQALAVGDEVAMLFGAAQRDPRRFDDPDTFDVGRNDPAHIGFGGGIHFCIGAPLARQELVRSVRGFVDRFPDLRLVEAPTNHPTFVIRGLTALRLATS
ncbi:MAG: cytochrome P450 [Verrucomicrobiales bacterium]|jgi:cytochrome P450